MKFVTLSLLATALTVGGNAAEQARSSKQPKIGRASCRERV